MIASRIASLVQRHGPEGELRRPGDVLPRDRQRQATSLRFDYEHPPAPPKPNRAWHTAKWLFNRMYWETVPQGRIPENAPFSRPTRTTKGGHAR